MARRRLLPGADARQGLVALALNSSTSLVAGAMLGSLTATFERRPGLLVLIPAAIGLRGNVFGSLGNRVSTSIHAGELQLRLRRSTVLGQNVLAAGALTLGMSLVLVVLAALVVGGPRPRRDDRARRPGPRVGRRRRARVDPRPGGHARAGGRRGPLRVGPRQRHGARSSPRSATSSRCPPSTSPPACSGFGLVTSTLGWVLAALAVVALVAGARSSLPQLRRIVRTSIPVLVIAGLVSSLAGVALERRLTTFSRAPRPAHPRARPPLERRRARRHPVRPPVEPAPPRPRATDGRPVARRPARPLVRRRAQRAGLRRSTASVPTSSRRLLGEASPGLAQLSARRCSAASPRCSWSLVIAYYGTIATVRLGIDPDTYGIPMVSSTVDLVGALTLVVAIATLGLV